MEKITLFRLTTTLLMALVLAWDLISALPALRHPHFHRDLLTTGALLWLITCFEPQSNDDDWASYA